MDDPRPETVRDFNSNRRTFERQSDHLNDHDEQCDGEKGINHFYTNTNVTSSAGAPVNAGTVRVTVAPV